MFFKDWNLLYLLENFPVQCKIRNKKGMGPEKIVCKIGNYLKTVKTRIWQKEDFYT